MSMFYKNNQPLGTLSSGGHTILNKLKQALTQRTKLMFGGGLKATDNSQDDITLVDDSADEIEFSDWIAKTEEEKEEYAEEHAKFDIINAPGVDELVELKLLAKLWENPDPTQAFAPQNITLSSDDYDFLLWNYAHYTGTSYYLSNVVPKGKNAFLFWANSQTNGVKVIRRYAGYVNDTTYSLGDGSSEQGTTVTTDQNGCVPVAIYGFKTNIKSIISAIASDVSISASKCMMSDGETSVEDAITESKYQNSEAITGNFTATKDGYLYVQTYLTFTSQQHTGTAYVNINNLTVYAHVVNLLSISAGSDNRSALIPIYKGDVVNFINSNIVWQTRLLYSR